jgi:hypothetical protein
MDKRRVSDLEEINQQEAHRFLTELMATQSAEVDHAMRHQEYTNHLHQRSRKRRLTQVNGKVENLA